MGDIITYNINTIISIYVVIKSHLKSFLGVLLAYFIRKIEKQIGVAEKIG